MKMASDSWTPHWLSQWHPAIKSSWLCLTSIVASACLLASLVSTASAASPRLLLADGTAVDAQLAETADDGKLAFNSVGKRITPSPRDLIRWGSFVTPSRGSLAVLDHGEVLTFSECRLDSESFHLQSAMFGEVQVPQASLRGLLFQPPEDTLERDRMLDAFLDLNKVEDVAPTANTVRVTLDNGDTVEGKLISMSNEELVLEPATGKLALGIDRIRAIAQLPSTKATPPRGLRLIIGTTDGSRVTATAISLTADGVQLSLASGTKWNLPREKLAAIQTLGGKATYLSDLPASGYKHVPYLATTWPLTTDRHVGGGRLRANGEVYLKGLGMHSAASTTYVLEKSYRRFDAALAIDASAGKHGSVVFRVYIDTGDGTWKLRHTSETIRGGDAPTPVSVDLTGAKRLSLIVDFADRADEGDRADWLDARLVE